MRIRRFDLFNGSKTFSSSKAAASDPEFAQQCVDAVELLPTYLADARQVTKHCVEEPDGALQLGVAENQMLEDLLVPALSKFAASEPAFAADWIYYQPTHGREGLRKAMANYLQRTLKLSSNMDVDGIVVGAGCNAVLENLCFSLASRGDAVLIPTPYYAAFEFDLVARAGLSIQPVTTFAHHSLDVDSLDNIPAEAYYPNRSSLDAAYAKSNQEGHPPRILLLSHPNNPLGICYPSHVIKECIDWCRDNQVHLVSDEIYAGSVYRDSTVFTSALELASDSSKNECLGLGPYIHLVYALSKDFALSGLRVGACYSENTKIRLGMQKLNDLCQVSSQTQCLVERMLTEKHDGENWTDVFLKQNNERIKARCDALQACLDSCGIPYLPADSGLFVWMDFRQYLDPAQDEDAASERTLYLELMKDFGLLFTPGLSMRTERPGFFRCVFTAATDEEFALSLERITKFAQARKV